MVEVSTRWVQRISRSAFRERFRRHVPRGVLSNVRLDDAAVEILASVSGRYLTPTQRRSLASVIREHLSLPALGPRYSGTLSMLDVMGVVLGLAQFLLAAGGRWVVFRIPESNGPTPDFLMMPPNGGAWRVEIKATAPLSSAVPSRTPLEVCRRFYAMRGAARKQLLAPGGSIRAGSPVIKATGVAQPTAMFALGGSAAVLVGLLDNGFRGRPLMLAPNTRGCPQGKRCFDHCSDGAQGPTPSAALGVLIGEPKPRLRAPVSPHLRQLVSLVRCAQVTSWTQNQGQTDRALLSAAWALRELRVEDAREVTEAGRLLVGALMDAPASTSPARRDAASIAHGFLEGRRLGRDLRRALVASANSPVAERALPASDTDWTDLPRTAAGLMRGRDYRIPGKGETGGARVVGDELRFAAPIDTIGAQLNGAVDGPSLWAVEACSQVLDRWGVRQVEAVPAIVSDQATGQHVRVGTTLRAGSRRLGWVSEDGRGVLFPSRLSR